EMLVGLIRGVDPKSQFAVRLTEAGCRVIIPALIDRRDTYSGNPRIAMTNQPHREWIYRQSYTMGRHVIGYEVHKVLALVDWLRPRLTEGLGRPTPLVLAGYGEGGLIAMYATAADTRIDGALVSGYFDSRQQVYDEPIYRNLFGLLREFGDAEIASLVYPRPLVIEYSEHPDVPGPPAAREGRRAVAAPGRIRTPEFGSVQAEVERAKKLLQNTSLKSHLPVLVAGQGGAPLPFGSRQAIDALCKRTGIELRSPKDADSGPTLTADAPLADADARQKRQVAELVEYNQRLLRLSPHVRASFWSKAKPASAETWAKDVQFYRDYFHDEIVGRFPPPSLPASPRSRRIFDKPKWQGYEVLLDVYPDVFAWGYLLVPKGIADGEKRPCVVCQHGLEGLPQDVLDEDADSAGYQTYRAYAARLAERGFVVFCPHNFYRGGNDFRQLQRKANPLKKTLFGLAVAQHTQITEWLAGLPFVDGERIGYYGLSYGGSTASRIPPLVPRYCLAINSANFNESVGKAVSVDYGFSYVFHGTYEWFEFGAGGTFSDGDMAALVAPRPYMVERGHDDGVSTDEWVAGEFARVRRLYDALGVGERARIEFFSGGHVINGRGTFEFLHEQFGWPAPSE
ncbi:MAG: dienelactone hydrolase family protein, partial [Planctomycetia bacterium]|nr:dienelactone hydrolase family protein [Planctomycetia bacterium]